MFGLDANLTWVLILLLLSVCVFEFINGFHDTANAVATVIYTNSLKPWTAVIWSGICNAAGVFAGGVTVAVGITNILPVEMLVDQNVAHNIAMVVAIVLTSIAWNLGTWYFGIPCSSSHTLIGSILGVGLAFSLLPGSVDSGVNWGKAIDIGISLLVSPLLGFSMTILVMYIMRRTIDNKQIFKEPEPGARPPKWIRNTLLLTCTGVSFSHGSNDGQKGVGLILLILIAIVPYYFAIDMTLKPDEIRAQMRGVERTLDKIDVAALDPGDSLEVVKAQFIANSIQADLQGKSSLQDLPKDKPFEIRKNVLYLNKSVNKITEIRGLGLTKKELKSLKAGVKKSSKVTDYSPSWVILMIAISLGTGTMIGWKRVVKTIGEKIGKHHMTYAQGASSEFVAATTISLATSLGLPVSTTHVLSSGIAGSMVASKGVKNLQTKTVKSMAYAWILTLPVCITLSFALFHLFRNIF